MRIETYQALKREAAERRGGPIQAKNFDHLLGKLKFTDRQLTEHFALYQGYVKKLNEILQKLPTVDRTSPNYSYNEYSELKRREPVAYNGTVLHELYFENLAEGGTTAASAETKDLLADSYGSFGGWLEDMKAAALSAHGWVLTVWDPLEKKLKTNLVASEHHVGLFADQRIVIALDAWEHAYMIQYGTKKTEYITAFFENLNWDMVDKRISRIAE